MKIEGFAGKIEPVSAKVLGFDASWVPVKDGDSVILTPAYTYYSEVELDNGEKIKRFVDYPVLRKRLK